MNYKLFQAINQWAGHFAWLDAAMVFISRYGLVIFALILIALWVKREEDKQRAALYAGFYGLLALCINFLTAAVYVEPRPFVTHAVHLLAPHAKDASFPSDHTSGAFGLALGMLMYNRKWGYGMLILAILTGFSRIFVGHHYPGDILGSIVVASVSSWLVFRYRHVVEPVVRMLLSIYDRLLSIFQKKRSKPLN